MPSQQNMVFIIITHFPKKQKKKLEMIESSLKEQECWLFFRENKQKGAKGGYEPCPASTAGIISILAYLIYN